MKNLIPWLNKKVNNVISNKEKDPWLDFKNSESFSISPGWSAFPNIDISENDKEVTIKAELPGMDEKDVELTYFNGILHFKGEKKEEHEENKNNFFQRESFYGSFSRSITLGNNLIWENSLAKFKNGTLTLNIPKKEDTGKKISINIE